MFLALPQTLIGLQTKHPTLSWLLTYQPREVMMTAIVLTRYSTTLSYLVLYSLSTLSVNEVLPSCGDTLYYTLNAQLYLQPQPVTHTEHPLTHTVKPFPSTATTY